MVADVPVGCYLSGGIDSCSILGLASAISQKSVKAFTIGFSDERYDETSKKLKIVAIDFGIKNSILNRLVSHGCEVLVFPSRSSLKDVLSNKPDGIFFSNGPGDPSSVSEGIDLAKSLIEYGEIPMFGICLGHQIFGLALGGSTYKLPFGHRGLNHPCGENNKIEITSQNHGFAIDPNSL